MLQQSELHLLESDLPYFCKQNLIPLRSDLLCMLRLEMLLSILWKVWFHTTVKNQHGHRKQLFLAQGSVYDVIYLCLVLMVS